MCKLFQFVLRSELASPLRDEVKRAEDKLLRACFLIDEKHPHVHELRFQGITIVRTMCKYFPEWLEGCPKVRNELLKIWQSKERAGRLNAEEGLELEHLLESKKLVKCLLSYARCKPSDHEVLFQMLTIFTVRSIVDYSFLKQFYAQVWFAFSLLGSAWRCGGVGWRDVGEGVVACCGGMSVWQGFSSLFWGVSSVVSLVCARVCRVGPLAVAQAGVYACAPERSSERGHAIVSISCILVCSAYACVHVYVCIYIYIHIYTYI